MQLMPPIHILKRFKVPNARRAACLLVSCLMIVLGANSILITGKYKTASMEVFDNFRRAVRVLRSNRDLPILFDHWRTAIRFSYYFDFKEGSHLYEGIDETVRVNRERA